MQLLYKSIATDTQVSTEECWLVGVELSHNDNSSMIVYDEADSTKTAAKKVVNMRVTSFTRQNLIFFPYDGIKCEGIYVDYNAGTGTIYYYKE